MQRRTHQDRRQPRGFSLIEILIVISILAALVALSLTVLGTAGNAANVAATRATITKVDALLRDQLAGFNRTQGNPTTAADLESKKSAAQSGFPQSSLEASLSADTSINTSAELLYKIITEGRVTGATPVGEDAFNGSELADTDGDGNLELVDAWGNPLRFYRWPTRLLNPFGHIENATSAAVPLETESSPPPPPPYSNIPLDDATAFQNVLNVIQNTSNGGDANATIFVTIGDEIVEIDGVSGSELTVSKRGAAGTSAEAHHDGATVKLAPFPQLVSLLMGSLTVGGATQDPDDPRGALHSAVEGGSLGYTVTGFEDEYHTLDSYHAPLIISAGPDGILGLLEPYDESNKGNLAIPDTSNGSDLSTIVNPGSTALSDNITNLSGGN
ncbi:MAG: prepilin-type N-terminal cleavage/methylation domain-containing protein [Planctomycetaceae bacterium]|nr:prepilin-type N-terminal cleavage/methylation domain-containing protein [Planctomycetaceae bacterium]